MGVSPAEGGQDGRTPRKKQGSERLLPIFHLLDIQKMCHHFNGYSQSGTEEVIKMETGFPRLVNADKTVGVPQEGGAE